MLCQPSTYRCVCFGIHLEVFQYCTEVSGVGASVNTGWNVAQRKQFTIVRIGSNYTYWVM